MGLFDNFKRKKNEKRTFSNMQRGLDSGYLVYYTQATNDYLRGNLQESLNNINKTIEVSDINDWKHYAFRANVYEDLKKYEKAIIDYNLSIELANNEVQIYALYHQVGFCYLNLGDNEKAVKNYTRALNLKKQHPNTKSNPDLEGLDGGVLLGVPIERIYNNRANALKNLGKLNEALDDCKKALSYNNQYSNTYLLLSQIFNLAGKENKAIDMLVQAANLGNTEAIRMLNKLR